MLLPGGLSSTAAASLAGVGVLALLGDRVPSELKVLLLGLAIVDDIGAILVIALFYTESVELGWLAGGLAILAGMVLLNRSHVRYLPLYVVLGTVVLTLTKREPNLGVW